MVEENPLSIAIAQINDLIQNKILELLEEDNRIEATALAESWNRMVSYAEYGQHSSVIIGLFGELLERR